MRLVQAFNTWYRGTAPKPIEIELNTFGPETKPFPTPSPIGVFLRKIPQNTSPVQNGASSDNDPFSAAPLAGRVTLFPELDEEPYENTLSQEGEQYYLDNLQALFDLEVQGLQFDYENARYRIDRWRIIDGMTDLYKKIPCSTSTFYTAVSLQEIVLLSYKIPVEKLKLVSLACLLIAIKSEEGSEGRVLCKKVHKETEKLYSLEKLFYLEREILTFMEWKVRRATPAHFLQSFEKFSLYSQTDQTDLKPVTESGKKITSARIYRHAKFFCDFCQKNITYLRYRPSLLAASAILCARRKLKFTPEWPHHLNHYTSYSKEELKECVDHIWKKYQRDFITDSTLARRRGFNLQSPIEIVNNNHDDPPTCVREKIMRPMKK